MHFIFLKKTFPQFNCKFVRFLRYLWIYFDDYTEVVTFYIEINSAPTIILKNFNKNIYQYFYHISVQIKIEVSCSIFVRK